MRTFRLHRPGAALGLAALLAAGTLAAQTPAPSVPPRPEDVRTLDGIVAAFYDVVSGPAGQPRQWARDSTLYMPGAWLVPTGVRPDGRRYARLQDHAAFARAAGPFMEKEGFHEREIHRVTNSFGNITHVWSTYEWRSTPDGPVGGRGINSIQLYHDGERWWILTASWDDERAGQPIPREYLP